MALFGQSKRHIPSKPRRSPLPFVAGDEKFSLSQSSTPSMNSSWSWYTIVVLPIPRVPFISRDGYGSANGYGTHKTFYAQPRPERYVRIPLPIPPRMYNRLARLNLVARIGMAAILLIAVVFVLLGFRKSAGTRNTWTPPFTDPSTLVLTPEEVAKIWEWEVLSGHHPSLQQVPESIPIQPGLVNPAVPATLLASPPAKDDSENRTGGGRTSVVNRHPLIGQGPARRYLAPWDEVLREPGFPPRPVPGAIMDLDVIVDKCDFGSNKYVRDCLELLRVGGNLDNAKRVRRGNYVAQFRQMYVEAPFEPKAEPNWEPIQAAVDPRPSSLSRDPLALAPPKPVSPSFDSLNEPCDPEHPRYFHMFWAGAFTDKPYMAVMSFLFTQNLGLDRPNEMSRDTVRQTCRPQFWVWINPGPAAAVPNPSAKREMYEQLATNPWSAPFLHERFRDVVKFKMWNTTEQLDGIPELAPYWRDMSIFNSGGNVYKQQSKKEREEAEEEAKREEAAKEEAAKKEETAKKKKKDTIFEKVGSKSANDYDRLSVILSDMARFVLTYRYGGVYLDADTIFLRDWEELWNYRGQFAYRWSWHQKYNTAILKLHKGSALSTFLFKTALENGFDFHPMTVSRYLKDAGLDKLLVRIPDALFDPAWLNMERYQRDRPPFPYFPEFSVFFTNDKFETAGPEQLGFDGFFRGAYSYHFHNFWWLPFDPTRNWPDLGERFAKGEAAAREALGAAKSKEFAATATTDEGAIGSTQREDMDDEIDLSWATVLKRTFEAYLRGERPNMYGEWINW